MDNLILLEARKFGIDDHVLERLSPYCGRSLVTWVLRRLHANNDSITPWLRLLADSVEGDWTYSKLKYAYFSSTITPLAELKTRREYKILRDTLESATCVTEFWDSILPYAYRGVVRFAAEILFENGDDPIDVAVKLDISVRLAYYIRKAYTEWKIAQENDTEFNE